MESGLVSEAVCKAFSGGTSLSDLLSCCFSRSGKPSEHEPDHRHKDPGFFTAGKHFVVLAEPTPGGKPGECSFHYPPPFEDVEADFSGSSPNRSPHPSVPRRRAGRSMDAPQFPQPSQTSL
jgi:hypothetical protein